MPQPSRRRGLAPFLVLIAFQELSACPIVTGILTRPGVTLESFPARILEISQVTQELFKDPSFDRSRAQKQTDRAIDIWLDLYLSYYLSPPEGFREHPHWRLVMDSITGPLRRLQQYAREGDWERGHNQLRILQDSLTEFYGEPPQRTAGGFGPIFHSLETVQVIPPGGGILKKERQARWILLQERFQAWKKRWKDVPLLPKAVQNFESKLDRLGEAVASQDGAGSSALAAELLTSSKAMIREALAAEWSTDSP